ncbi:MAG: methyltransferase [Candidatus Pacebacteria bacterium]|nr:methyltransferase [Candidatus Paceibacterota bacterium]
MKAEKFNIGPVQILLDRHMVHKTPYCIRFMDTEFIIYPDVFNPTYTKVSSLLARNIKILPDQVVLEMFCGSGAVGLSAMKNAQKLVGVDISPQAVICSVENAKRLGYSYKTEFRLGSLWDTVNPNEKFDVILANPPLLPAIPETLLEMAVADSPEMNLTRNFITGLPAHLSNNGYALMAFSNACSVYVGDPIKFVEDLSNQVGIVSKVDDELDVGYEVYRIIKFTKPERQNGKNHSNG